MRRLAPLVLLSLLAGCTDEPAPDAPDPTVAPGPVDNRTVEPIVAAPWNAVLHIDGATLSATPPAEGSVALDGFVRPMATNSVGELRFMSPAWPSVSHVAAQTVVITLVLQTDAVAHGNGVFDVAAWFGTTRGESAFAFTTTGPLLPGTPREVVFQLDLNDHPGIVLPAGESYTLRVADSYEPEMGTVELLTGPDGSRVEFTVQNLTDDPFVPMRAATQSFSGQVTGGTFVECPAAEDALTFSIRDNASWVSVQVDAESAAGAPLDVDLDVLDGSAPIWHAGSPTPREEILLAGEALAPYRGQDLQARASICLGGHADYEIVVEQG